MTALQFWLLMAVMYAMGTIWWTVILRRLGKEVPRAFKRAWIFGAIGILVFIVKSLL